MKDTSNIFKLPSNELETKKSSLDVLWDDTAPEIVDFAKKLLQESALNNMPVAIIAANILVIVISWIRMKRNR